MKIDLCELFGVEEGEEFQIELNDGLIEDLKYRVEDNCLEWCEKEIEVENRYYYAGFGVNDIKDIENIIKLPKKKQFTDDELAIMRSLPINYKWIARDITDEIFVYGIVQEHIDSMESNERKIAEYLVLKYSEIAPVAIDTLGEFDGGNIGNREKREEWYRLLTDEEFNIFSKFEELGVIQSAKEARNN